VSNEPDPADNAEQRQQERDLDSLEDSVEEDVTDSGSANM